MDKFEKGTILYDLQPYCNALLPVMRDEKDRKDATYQEISDATGITMDAIKRFYTGEHKQPSVYKIAALCRYFGLSMDALFGFVPTPMTVAYTELEEKNAEIASLKEHDRILENELAAQHAEYEEKISEYKDHLADLKHDKSEIVSSLQKEYAYLQSLLAEHEAEYKNKLKEVKDAYQAELNRKTRTIRILGIALGVVIVILLALFVTNALISHIGWLRY